MLRHRLGELKEAEAAYQKKHQRENSSSGLGHKMTEKEKLARRNKIVKDRKERAEAIKVLPGVMKKILAAKPTQKGGSGSAAT